MAAGGNWGESYDFDEEEEYAAVYDTVAVGDGGLVSDGEDADDRRAASDGESDDDGPTADAVSAQDSVQAEGGVGYNAQDFTKADVRQRPEDVISSDRLMSAYGDPDAVADTKRNSLMAVGTGGSGLWERSWSKLMAEQLGESDRDKLLLMLYEQPLQEPGMLRAMALAADVAQPYELARRDFGMAVYRQTDVSEARRASMHAGVAEGVERFNNLTDGGKAEQGLNMSDEEKEALMQQWRAAFDERKAERDAQQAVEAEVAAYAEKNPAGWQEKLEAVGMVVRHGVDLGTHLTMLGIFKGDEDLVKAGRQMMFEAVNGGRDFVREEGVLSELVKTWEDGSSAGVHDDLGAARGVYVDLALGQFNLDRVEEHEARRFLSESVVSWDMSAIYRENISALSDLGAKEGGPSSWMRAISDKVFKNKDGVFAAEVVEPVAFGDAGAANEAYGDMRDFQQALIAVASAYQAGDEGFEADSRLERDRIAAELDLLVSAGMDEGELRDAIRSMVPAVDHDEAGTAAELRREVAMMAGACLDGAAIHARREEQDENGEWNPSHWVVQYNVNVASGLIALCRDNRIEAAMGTLSLRR